MTGNIEKYTRLRTKILTLLQKKEKLDTVEILTTLVDTLGYSIAEANGRNRERSLSMLDKIHRDVRKNMDIILSKKDDFNPEDLR